MRRSGCANGARNGLPEGFKDLLPPLAGKKRAVETCFMEVFARWGYREVATPTLELQDASSAVGRGMDERTYRLIDRDGQVMALRPDMTAAVARLAASRVRPGDGPLRLCYSANVFRYEPRQTGRSRELFQAGVELVGAAGPAADAEVVAVAVECLEAVGLEDFKVGVGHLGLVQGILDELELEGESRGTLAAALARRDLVEVEAKLSALGLEGPAREALLEAATLRNGQEAVSHLGGMLRGDRAREALGWLGELFETLDCLGSGGRIYLDLGVVRDLDYYTGVVFELLVPGLGYPVGGGGRYDGLAGRYGQALPATGFAIGTSEVLEVLARRGASPGRPAWSDAPDYYVAPEVADPGALRRAAEVARRLRGQGFRVEMDLERRGVGREAVVERARRSGAAAAMLVGPGGCREVPLGGRLPRPRVRPPEAIPNCSIH